MPASEGVNPRERIIETARALFQEKGFDATSVNDLIAAAATHKASFYRYFKDKEEIATEYLRRERDAFAAGLRTLMARSETPEAYFITWSTLLMRQVKAGKFHGCRVSRLMQTLATADAELKRESAAAIDTWIGLLAEFLALHKAARRFRGDPEKTAEKILRLFQGTAAMYRLHGKKEVFDYLREDMLAEITSRSPA